MGVFVHGMCSLVPLDVDDTHTLSLTDLTCVFAIYVLSAVWATRSDSTREGSERRHGSCWDCKRGECHFSYQLLPNLVVPFLKRK